MKYEKPEAIYVTFETEIVTAPGDVSNVTANPDIDEPG